MKSTSKSKNQNDQNRLFQELYDMMKERINALPHYIPITDADMRYLQGYIDAIHDCVDEGTMAVENGIESLRGVYQSIVIMFGAIMRSIQGIGLDDEEQEERYT